MNSSSHTNDEVIQSIRLLEQRWIEVYLNKDTTGFAALMTDDFIYSSERGVFDKAHYVANLAAGTIQMRAFENTELNIRVHHDTAISTGIATLQASLEGRDISGPERFTRVWIREANGWLAISLHASQIPGQ